MDKLGSLSTGDRERQAKGLGRLDLDCPPLPHTLFEAMRIAENPDSADHARVMRMVQNDPLVVVRLLRIANSPYYGFKRKIESADRVVRLLGPSAVAGIVMGMNVVRLQTAMDGPAGEVLGRAIRHGLATAHLSEWIMRQVAPGADAQQAFTAGLLHDLGKLVLIYNYPTEAVAVYAPGASRTPDEWLHAETTAFGCDHLEAGLYVAEHLEFPPSLVKVLARSHDTESNLTTVIQAADVAVRSFGFEFSESISAEDCLGSETWHDLAMAFPERAGDSDLFAESVLERSEETSRYVFQLLVRRTDRAPSAPTRTGGGSPRIPDSDSGAT